jgi:hypothetical protein
MPPDRGNYVSEWFGHRVYPTVAPGPNSLGDQERENCPFLSAVTDEARRCIKSAAAKGVCTISTATSGKRMDWLVCPYRALDPRMIEDAVRRLFGFPAHQAAFIVPAIRLVDMEIRQGIADRLGNGGRVFVYFDEKLGGELSIPPTARSPEFSFDVTIIEIELVDGKAHVGRFGVIEIQTMDFHGSYRKVVTNLKDGLRLHPSNFAATLQENQRWLSEDIEGPNIANVFKRTFYQMMFKFQLGKSPRCAGCVLAVPMSVWESWQRHLGNPELTPESDGTWNLFRDGRPRPAVVPAWIYAFDLNSDVTESPGPIALSKIIATDAPSMSFYALEVAPAAAIENIASPSGMLSLLARRLGRLWPELGATLTA